MAWGRAVKVGLVPMGRRRGEGEALVSSAVPDDEHWAVRASDDGLCHASEQKPLHAPSALGANHDEVRPGAARLSQDGLSRITVKHEVFGGYVTGAAGRNGLPEFLFGPFMGGVARANRPAHRRLSQHVSRPASVAGRSA